MYKEALNTVKNKYKDNQNYSFLFKEIEESLAKISV